MFGIFGASVAMRAESNVGLSMEPTGPIFITANAPVAKTALLVWN
jgi:hypothetical protein